MQQRQLFLELLQLLACTTRSNPEGNEREHFIPMSSLLKDCLISLHHMLSWSYLGFHGILPRKLCLKLFLSLYLKHIVLLHRGLSSSAIVVSKPDCSPQESVVGVKPDKGVDHSLVSHE